MTRPRPTARLAAPLSLDCGSRLVDVEVGYETWGTLSEARDNAVLVCHSLTKDAHAARTSDDDRPGWWEAAIGPGALIDTDRYFVICTDTLAAGASTRPSSVEPGTGRPYGSRFPVVTIADMVRAQRGLLDVLGVPRLHAVVGGCMGGQQALQWAIDYPADVERVVAIAVTPTTSAHSIAIFAVMRHLIRSDPAWLGGDYPATAVPTDGVNRAVAAAVPLWMSRDALERRFGRTRVPDTDRYTLGPDFTVERFIEQIAGAPRHGIDPNGLIHLTKAVEYFDLLSDGDLTAALRPVQADTLLVSYAADWRYPTQEVQQLCDALLASGRRARHQVLDSPLGHGGFMLDPSDLAEVVRPFLAATTTRTPAAVVR